MHKVLVVLLSLSALFCRSAQAQKSVRDTSISLVAISATYAYQIPGGDMALRFGANSNIGLNVVRKLKSNYLFGLEAGFLFGNDVRESGLLQNMITAQGQILDQEGIMADVLLYERGYTVMAVAGKIMPITGPNRNSGMLLKLGVGYMRHKIRIQTQNNTVPQLEDEYLEGYDRLSAGPATMLFIGYQHFGNRGRINFVAGFEVTMGFTQPMRAYNFDTQRAESGSRLDGLTGFRVGWTLPIYKKADDRFHYF